VYPLTNYLRRKYW